MENYRKRRRRVAETRMTGRVRRRLRAQFDLINHSLYLVTERSPETADRFVDAAEAAFAQLAGQPQMG